MEGYDAFEGDRSSRPRRHKRHSSPAYEDDWTRTYYQPVHSPPRRRAQEEIHRPDHHRGQSSHYGRPSATRAPLSSSFSSLRPPRTAMPLLTRSSTAPNRRSTYEAWNSNSYDDDLSHSDSRRSSSRRDMSPPSHLYRSTPDSRRSSPRTSVCECESEGETELTASTQDNRGRGKGPDIIPDKSVLADRLRPRSKRRRRRRRTRPEDVIFEEELDHRDPDPRPPPSLDRHRSPSRHSSDRHHHRHHSSHRHHRAPVEERDPHLRSSSRRSSSRYYEAEVRYPEKPALLRRSNTTGGPHDTQSVSSSRRSSRLLKGFFGLSHQHTRPSSRKPVKHVECVVCMDGLPRQKVAKLRCGHSMCHSCLKRSFKLSITDPQHMPPRCCTKDHIPLKHVDRLFNAQFKKTWNEKYREYSTRNRVYCPSRKCGEWIPPEDIHRDEGKKCARCHHCKTKICCQCHGKWHSSGDCPRDEDTNEVLRQAKKEGWKRCYKCKSLVERNEGCNHMMCRCGAEFCMVCGNKWRTCDCQWLNYDDVENDRLAHMQIPMDIRANPMGPMPLQPRDHMPAMQPPPFAPMPMVVNHMSPHTPPHTPHAPPHVNAHVYDDDRRRRMPQEQDDDALARRLQAVPLDDDFRGGMGDPMGMGHQAGPFASEDYRRGPMNPLAPAAPTPPPAAAPPVQHAATLERSNSATDYISGVNKARGVFAPGMERRLADRFSTEPRTSPTHRHAPTGFGPPPPPPGAMIHTQPSMSALPMQPMQPMQPMPSMPSMPSMQSMSMPPMSMPTAPVPPPAVPGYPSSPRRHSVADPEYYDSPRRHRPRSSERPSANYSRRREIYEEDAEDAEEERPRTSSRSRRRHHHHRQHQREEPEIKSSMLAGLTGPGAGMNRVFEWRNHVEPGPPEEGQQLPPASTRS